MQTENKRKIPWNLLLVLTLFILGGLLLLSVLLFSQQGETVQIRVGGEITESFSLKEDREYDITGTDGGTNRLIIRDGAAWFSEADCPDRLCMNMGKIRRTGQSIVCLPHQVVVEITGGADDDVDLISGGK